MKNIYRQSATRVDTRSQELTNSKRQSWQQTWYVCSLPSVQTFCICWFDGCPSLQHSICLQIAAAAHYMGSPWCVKACLKAINSVPAQQMSKKCIRKLVDATSWLPDLASTVDTFDLFQALDAVPTVSKEDLCKLKPSLKALFGKVDVVLQNEHLRKRFGKLSLRAVEVWSGMDTLLVTGQKFESENDIVSMLSLWWKAQPG
jgi:hypothetical protein